MKRQWILTVVATALMLSPIFNPLAPLAAQSSEGIQWMSYQEGRERGEAENKKVFLVFEADWCRYCAQMEKETFQNPTVIAYVNRNFVPISVNSDREQEIAAKYNVRDCPAPGSSPRMETPSVTGPAISLRKRCSRSSNTSGLTATGR